MIGAETESLTKAITENTNASAMASVAIQPALRPGQRA